MDIKIEKVGAQVEKIDIQDWVSIEVQKSEIWEINNPRVKGMMRALVAIVSNIDELEDAIKMDIINNIFGLIGIYGDKDFIKNREEEGK